MSRAHSVDAEGLQPFRHVAAWTPPAWTHALFDARPLLSSLSASCRQTAGGVSVAQVASAPAPGRVACVCTAAAGPTLLAPARGAGIVCGACEPRVAWPRPVVAQLLRRRHSCAAVCSLTPPPLHPCARTSHLPAALRRSPQRRSRRWYAARQPGDFRPAPAKARAPTAKTQVFDMASRPRGFFNNNIRIHSHRATVASSVAQAKQDGMAHMTDDVAQVLCRWKTLESVARYTRLNAAQYANLVRLATDADASKHKGTVAEVDPRETLDELEQVVAALDNKAEASGSQANQKPSSARRAAPGGGEATAAPAPREKIEIVGCDEHVEVAGQDSWNLLGTTVSLPNDIWGINDGGSTDCKIEHFLNKHKFAEKGKHVAYAVSYEGGDELYAVRADGILKRLTPSQRKTLGKSSMLPKPVSK